MTAPVEVHYRRWGEGPPVLALHGLGLESSSFTGLGRWVNEMGLSMVAADLPGFGLSIAPDAPLTMHNLAEPVLDLAASLDEKPLVMGMSLGARVALEAALLAPDLFRGAVMLATPLPWRTHRWALNGARIMNPELFKLLPLQWAWPVLKRQADRLEHELEGGSQHDWFLRSSKRAIYYMSCPATRWAFASALRELALDPAYGPEGVWSRLDQLAIPAAFVWGDKDHFIGTSSLAPVAELVPAAFQLRVQCAGHFANGPHFECFEEGALEAIRLVEETARTGWSPSFVGNTTTVECTAGQKHGPESADAPAVHEGVSP